MSLPTTAVVSLSEMLEHVSQTDFVDAELLERKIVAAQAHLEDMLGFKFVTEYPTAGGVSFPATVPADIREAVLQLAAWWYVQREAGLVGTTASSIPMGVKDIVANHRQYSWGASDE